MEEPSREVKPLTAGLKGPLKTEKYKACPAYCGFAYSAYTTVGRRAHPCLHVTRVWMFLEVI